MHVKDLLDDLDIRVKLPQHWYSTDISDNFEEGKLIEISAKEITLNPGNSIVSFDGDFSEADSYKIMILDENGKISGLF